MNITDVFTVLLALVFGYILIQTLLFIVFPVEPGIIRVYLPKEQEYPSWSYQHRYRNWIYGLPGMRGPNDPLPPSSPYVPGVGRVWKV